MSAPTAGPEAKKYVVWLAATAVLWGGPARIAKVRFNLNGELRVPFGYVAGLQCDPVEKKPFYRRVSRE